MTTTGADNANKKTFHVDPERIKAVGATNVVVTNLSVGRPSCRVANPGLRSEMHLVNTAIGPGLH